MRGDEQCTHACTTSDLFVLIYQVIISLLNRIWHYFMHKKCLHACNIFICSIFEGAVQRILYIHTCGEFSYCFKIEKN